MDEKCDMIDQEAWGIIQTRSDLHKNDILFASISEEGNAYILNEEPTNWNINESVFCVKVLLNNKLYKIIINFAVILYTSHHYIELHDTYLVCCHI